MGGTPSGLNYAVSDCSNIKVLVVMVNYRSAKFHGWRKLGKAYAESLCMIFFTTVYEFIIISK